MKGRGRDLIVSTRLYADSTEAPPTRDSPEAPPALLASLSNTFDRLNASCESRTSNPLAAAAHDAKQPCLGGD